MADSTPYSTVLPLTAGLPTWINSYDAQRLAAYKVYDDMYNSNPGTDTLMLRGENDLPIIIPTAKSIVNTMARYVARGFGFAVAKDGGTPEQQAEAIMAYGDLFERENILSKMAMAKKDMMKLGDVFWYIQGDTSRPEGQRLSIKTVDAGLVQKLTHPEDPDRVVGYQIMEQMQDGDTVVIMRQRWLKNTSPLHPDYGNFEAPVIYDKIKLEVENWESPEEQKVIQTITPAMYFPPQIKQLPLYHMPNNPETGNPYGSSEIRSLERLIAGINQAVSDEDLALAMAGLGMYKSDSGGPVDEQGNDVDWNLGPGKVVEDSSFERVSGVASVQPSLEHIRYLEEKIDSIAGITDVTRGAVSADVAESGIALSIRMAPTIDAANEKDLIIKGVFDQLLYDLKFWFEAFEGKNLHDCKITTAFGDKLPRNRQQDLSELLELFTAGLVSMQYVHAQLQEKFGYDIPEDMIQQLADDAAKKRAAADPYGDRLADPEAEPAEGSEEV